MKSREFTPQSEINKYGTEGEQECGTCGNPKYLKRCNVCNTAMSKLDYNKGVDQLVYNIYKQREKGEITVPVILQLTLNKEFYSGNLGYSLGAALVETAKRALQLVDGTRVVDGISLGLSSPNTAGMRLSQDQGLREAGVLNEALNAVAYTIKAIDSDMTLIYKGDGDGGEERLNIYAQMIEMQGEHYVDALELINTTRSPDILACYGIPRNLEGGVAGNDEAYKKLALEAIRYVYERVGSVVDIIGTGGGANQAFEMIEAGASHGCDKGNYSKLLELLGVE